MSTLIIKNVDSEFINAFKALAKSIKADFSVKEERAKKPSKKLQKALKQVQMGEVERFESFDEFKKAMIGEV